MRKVVTVKRRRGDKKPQQRKQKLAYFLGSTTHIHLSEIAKRMHGKVAASFSGIIVGDVYILYRYANAYLQPMRGKKYPRWHWKKPFGKESDWRLVDYVLLHGPEIGQYDEAFFLFTVREARRLATSWRDNLNVSAEPIRESRTERDAILKHQRTLREVIRTVS